MTATEARLRIERAELELRFPRRSTSAAWRPARPARSEAEIRKRALLNALEVAAASDADRRAAGQAVPAAPVFLRFGSTIRVERLVEFAAGAHLS